MGLQAYLEFCKTVDEDTYVLDYSLWRCGGDVTEVSKEGETALGVGQVTRMLNKQGRMCCLGQFAIQKGVPEQTLLKGGASPRIVADTLGERYDPLFVTEGAKNTGLSDVLMYINDESHTPLFEKFSLIRKKLGAHGKKLVAINTPKVWE